MHHAVVIFMNEVNWNPIFISHLCTVVLQIYCDPLTLFKVTTISRKLVSKLNNKLISGIIIIYIHI